MVGRARSPLRLRREPWQFRRDAAIADQAFQWLLRLSGAALLAAAAISAGAYADEAALPARQQAAPAEPLNYRMDDYRSRTPLTLKGASVVSSTEAMNLWRRKAAIFIDVMPRPRKPDNLPPQTLWHVPEHANIPGSVWLPNTGYGVLSPSAAAYFQQHLERLSEGDKLAPLLFYCLRDCWMSWNAAKRAIALGYANVRWFPDGSEGWTAIGGTLAPSLPAQPAP